MDTLGPLLQVASIGALLALAPLAWVASQRSRPASGSRLDRLARLLLVLTFELVLFGAFTRLSDSGLGCPDWPGCYGSASPAGAHHAIGAAEAAQPDGPVTHMKAWIEMTHRYLASAVGLLIAVLAAGRLRAVTGRSRSRAAMPGAEAAAPSRPAGALSSRDSRLAAWSAATFLWVCLQGAFGALTVTWKLYPAIVTAHLLGGFGLLALLAVQVQWQTQAASGLVSISRPLRAGMMAVVALAVVQATLGGWVSTNYAVLACRDFPTCQGAWWPDMDFESGFAVARGLGAAEGGGYLPFAALTAIHMAHRLGALALLPTLVLLAARIRLQGDVRLRRYAAGLAGVAIWQMASGWANVAWGWPLAAALAHTGGAAALVVLFARLIAGTTAGRTARADRPVRPAVVGRPAQADL